jgi:hypothetical protein
MTIISALERQSHEDHGFEDSLGYRVKPCLKKKKIHVSVLRKSTSKPQ